MLNASSTSSNTGASPAYLVRSNCLKPGPAAERGRGAGGTLPLHTDGNSSSQLPVTLPPVCNGNFVSLHGLPSSWGKCRSCKFKTRNGMYRLKGPIRSSSLIFFYSAGQKILPRSLSPELGHSCLGKTSCRKVSGQDWKTPWDGESTSFYRSLIQCLDTCCYKAAPCFFSVSVVHHWVLFSD